MNALHTFLGGSRTTRLALPVFGEAVQNGPADQFASWLPYSAYLANERIFVNRDGMGFLLEVMPQSGADERMTEVLVSLYANCPPGTGLQFHLFASPHIRHQLRQYTNLRVEDQVGGIAHAAGQHGRAQRGGHRITQRQQRVAAVQIGRLARHGHAEHQPEIA
jgi:hypothetical protein